MHLNISEDTLCTASSIDPSDYDKSVFNTDYTETLVLNTLTFFVCDNSWRSIRLGLKFRF
jgi:hypothetical protein